MLGLSTPASAEWNHGWDNWQIAFTNKLNATLGAAQVPINYIIREEDPGTEELFFTEEEERYYQMPLEGQNFKHNNKLVYNMLKERKE